MGSKSYDQYCPVAAGLDLIGDRWTLLVLRELAFSEQRFSDLRSALPGIASNLLTDRLRGLQEAGLVEQHLLPPPAARSVYRLTRDGARVRPVLRAVAQLGLPYLAAPAAGQVSPRSAVLGGVGAMFDGAGAVGANLLVRFLVEGEEHLLEVRDGRLVRPDPNRTPDLTVTGSAVALFDLARGAGSEQLVLEGTTSARRTFARCFPSSVTAR